MSESSKPKQTTTTTKQTNNNHQNHKRKCKPLFRTHVAFFFWEDNSLPTKSDSLYNEERVLKWVQMKHTVAVQSHTLHSLAPYKRWNRKTGLYIRASLHCHSKKKKKKHVCRNCSLNIFLVVAQRRQGHDCMKRPMSNFLSLFLVYVLLYENNNNNNVFFSVSFVLRSTKPITWNNISGIKKQQLTLR